MARKTIKIKAKLKKGITTVKCLIKHPMETGLRTDKKTGLKKPAHFIQTVTCKYNGEVVMQADWGVSISKNPYVSFKINGGVKKEKIEISWTDNLGKSDSRTKKIK